MPQRLVYKVPILPASPWQPHSIAPKYSIAFGHSGGPAQAARTARTFIYGILWPWNLTPSCLWNAALEKHISMAGMGNKKTNPAEPPRQFMQVCCIWDMLMHLSWLWKILSLYCCCLGYIRARKKGGPVAWCPGEGRLGALKLFPGLRHIRKQEPPVGWLWMVDAKWGLPELLCPCSRYILCGRAAGTPLGWWLRTTLICRCCLGLGWSTGVDMAHGTTLSWSTVILLALYHRDAQYLDLHLNKYYLPNFRMH